MLEFLFFVSLLGVVYSYFLYPLLLLPFQGRNRLQPDLPAGEPPMMTFIITAYNEEAGIADKIEDTLKARYPRERLEILVASDGSTDRTNAIVEGYADRGVELVDVPDRKGKENAQWHAIRRARGELLVFSDVSTRIEESALERIAEDFRISRVGAVSSEDRFITEDGKIAGEGAYVKYEMWLRKLESSAYSLVGLSGSFFACRAEIAEDWNTGIPSDFNTAINCVRKGRIAITDPQLLGFYPNLKDESREFQRKVRTVLRGMAALFHDPSLLNPLRYGFFSFELISHKLMRWLVPGFMLATLLINLMLPWNGFYGLMLIAQLGFYGLGAAAFANTGLREHKLIKLIYFFIQVNLAIAQAWMLYLRGQRIARWEPSKR